MTYVGPGALPERPALWVRNVQQACTVQGTCQLSKAAEQLEMAQHMLVQAERIGAEMDPLAEFRSLWCDFGGHPFSPRDPGRQRLQVAVLQGDGVTETEEARMMCGACADQNGMLKQRITNAARKMLPGGKVNSAYTEKLEGELGIGGQS